MKNSNKKLRSTDQLIKIYFGLFCFIACVIGLFCSFFAKYNPDIYNTFWICVPSLMFFAGTIASYTIMNYELNK